MEKQTIERINKLKIKLLQLEEKSKEIIRNAEKNTDQEVASLLLNVAVETDKLRNQIEEIEYAEFIKTHSK